MTIEEQIVARFIEKVVADGAIPPETAQRIEALWKERNLKSVDAILDAIKQGVNANDQNSTA